MRKLLLLLPMLGALSFTSTQAAAYNVFCEIEDDVAHGYVAVPSFESLTVSGYVTFRIYDEDGDLIDTERNYEYEYIYGDTELVSTVDVDEDAQFCTFDISEAVEEPSPDPQPDPTPIEYSTDCMIIDGVAYGYVTVHSFDSMTISGDVHFTIFDEDGDVIDRESSYEYAYIYHDRELVDEVEVDDDARFCSFDVSEAIGDPR